MKIDLKQLKELMKTLQQFDMAELEVEYKGERIRLRRSEQHVAGTFMPASLPAQSLNTSASNTSASLAAEKAATSAAPAKSRDGLVAITSPFVGTFYRSPSPDSASFVEVGTQIKKGKVLCIVEAMKLMNEIESDISGTIEEILVENGKPVEYGAELFLVRKV